jgi:hypothetical protein
MALNPSTIGDNAQQPSVSAETFIPDQLIAGSLKLVSDVGTVTGSAALPRGSVMGLTKFGSVVGTAGKGFASGSIAVAVNPTAGDTLTIQGTVVTFQAAVFDTAPPANTVNIGATAAATAQALLAFLQNSTNANISKMTYSLSGAVITATSVVVGSTVGNALTLATSNSTAFTLSGSTLSGGVNNVGGATLSAMTAGNKVQAGNYVATCLTATTAQVVDPNGEEIGIATFGTPFQDAQINFTITASGTACDAATVPDQFVFLASPQSPGLYKLATAGAVDGSEVPSAILADQTDPTSGNVSAGVYLMGEFNGNVLNIDPSLSLAAVKAAFAGKGIFIKNVVSADDPS